MDAPFPVRRLRRLRRTWALREAVADVSLEPRHLVMPLFVHEGEEAQPVASMPGVWRWPVRGAVEQVRALRGRGVRMFLLFGVTPEGEKDATGSYAASPDAAVNRVLSEVREAGLDAAMVADLCFCEYTEHGHCGVLEGGDNLPSPFLGRGAGGEGSSATGLATGTAKDEREESPHPQPLSLRRESGVGAERSVDNDATLALLAEAAVAQARAGADVIAPSGMMDGQVAAIRGALDAARFEHTAILSYSVKYASAFYGPFREAGGCSLSRGQVAGGGGQSEKPVASDRRGYQMDPRRSREWRLELAADLAEGADLVMVKPAMAYLDVMAGVRAACEVPVVAYHVSGEYAMLHAAAERGWLDLDAAAVEATVAMRRAGADLIVTYFTPDLVARL